MIVESFRPGVVSSLSVDYATIAKINPRIVYASISGYGQTGPRSQVAGHDINYLGYAGVLDQTGMRNGPPALCNLQIADLLGGAACAAIGILAALVGAQRTGRGRHVDVAMADASLAHNIFALHALAQWGRTLPRGEDLLTGGVPCYGVYGTQDGRWLAVGALEDKFWQALCVAVDRPDLAPRASRLARMASEYAANWKRCSPLRRSRIGSERFADVDCCVTPVNTLDEALADPQFVAREMIVERPDGSRQYAPPFKLSGHEFAVISRRASARRANGGDPARSRLRRRCDWSAGRRRGDRDGSDAQALNACRGREAAAFSSFVTPFTKATSAPLARRAHDPRLAFARRSGWDSTRTAPTGSSATRAYSGSVKRQPAAT